MGCKLAMKDYTEISKGVYQSNNSKPTRAVDAARIREIVKGRPSPTPPPQRPHEERKSAAPASEFVR